MNDPTASSGSEPRYPEGRIAAVILVAVLLVLAVVVVEEYPRPVTHEAPIGPGPPLVGGPTVSTNLTVSAEALGTLSSEFWGVNLRADVDAYPARLSTGTGLVRWPGGSIADRLNFSANGGAGILYNESTGATSAPAMTATEFVSWCESVGCAAIFTVPAEIDDPSAAAYLVSYTERTLGFHPAYWEIGNEPALWTHFDVPWDQWGSSADSTVTAPIFAQVVHAYVAAMRGVDPTLRIIGLGGMGGGSSGEATWIQDVVSVNGPNLSAVAIHAYPAGGGSPGESATAVYSSLNGSGGLATRVPEDRAAIAAGCAKCPISLLVDEYNAATGLTLDDFLEGFSLVPYDAAMVTQGMDLNLTSMDLFCFENGYGGSWFAPGGGERPVYELYSSLLPRLGPRVLETWMQPSRSSLFVAATENFSGPTTTAVLLVNTNTSVALSVSLTSGLPLGGPVTLWSWNSSAASPVESTSATSPLILELPPESVTVWVGQGSVIP